MNKYVNGMAIADIDKNSVYVSGIEKRMQEISRPAETRSNILFALHFQIFRAAYPIENRYINNPIRPLVPNEAT